MARARWNVSQLNGLHWGISVLRDFRLLYSPAMGQKSGRRKAAFDPVWNILETAHSSTLSSLHNCFRAIPTVGVDHGRHKHYSLLRIRRGDASIDATQP